MPAYISEIDVVGRAPGNTDPDSVEFVEIAVTSGTDLSGYAIYVYSADGTVSEGPLSQGTVQSTVAGKDCYLVNGASGLGDITYSEAIALVDDLGTVVQFISFNGNTVTGTAGPANGLSSTNIGTHGFDQSLQSVDGGASYTTQSTQTPGVVPCYAPGTMIETPDGPRAVETLKSGDFVMTLDHGPQPIRWIHCRDHPLCLTSALMGQFGAI